jgi:hypothetical protein
MEMSGELHGPESLLPKRQLAVVSEYEAGWTSVPFWMFWRRQFSFIFAGNQTTFPLFQTVA